MPQYLISFNQQWVGDHTEEWFRGLGPLAMAVVEEMKAADVHVGRQDCRSVRLAPGGSSLQTVTWHRGAIS